jgi:hypothetical protein
MTTFTTKREALYGGPLARGKRHHYVTYLAGVQVGYGETKQAAEAAAAANLLGAYQQRNSTIYASVTSDGHVVTTREYAPGEVEFSHHREANGRQGGSMMSSLELLDASYTKRKVSVAEFHAHHLAAYNAAATPRVPAVCALCGEAHTDHRPASGNSAAFCMSRHSRPGDTFVRGRQ